MPSLKKLVKEGRFLEAAKVYRDRGLRQRDVHKRRRFLNFAGRYFEAGGDFSLATKSFLESGDLERTLGAAIKAKNPKVLSNTLVEAGREQEETIKLLLRCSLQLVDAREFAGARAFAKEAYDMGRSSLAEALINLVDGYLEGKPDKIASSVKATRIPGESDVLAREINFVAGKFLASVPKLSGEVKVPTRCPECGAPLPLKAKGRVIECEYCGYPVRLD